MFTHERGRIFHGEGADLTCSVLFALKGLFKRLAYTLTAYCYGSKSVTQPDASSKRYLWEKVSC